MTTVPMYSQRTAVENGSSQYNQSIDRIRQSLRWADLSPELQIQTDRQTDRQAGRQALGLARKLIHSRRIIRNTANRQFRALVSSINCSMPE